MRTPVRPGSLTDVERARRSRARRETSTVELPGDVVDALDAIAAQAGDAGRVACVTRLVREATEGNGP